MNTIKQQTAAATLAELAVPTAEEAISQVNGWLLREVAFAVNVSRADYSAVTHSWHLPVQLAFPDTGPVGVIGDIHLHAVTGRFAEAPTAQELRQRAELLGHALGLLPLADEE